MAEAKTTAKKPTKRASTKAIKPAAAEKPAVKKTKPSNEKGAYAVFATGGKQYLVTPGQRLRVEILKSSTSSDQGAYKEGDSLTFDNVLLSGTQEDSTFGTPFIKGSAVTATLAKIGRAKKIDVIKYKQKSRYFKKNGHRQPYFEIVIDSIK